MFVGFSALVIFVREGKKKEEILNSLLVIGVRVVLMMSTSKRELDTVALQLFTVRERLHRRGVLVQEINRFERQSLGLKKRA